METLNFTLGLGDPFTNGTSSCTFAQDPDISGIGVRISFYLQNFFLACLVIFPERVKQDSSPTDVSSEKGSSEDASGSLWTFLFTNFGLVLTAFIQTGSKKLTLFQALEVTNLLWLGNFSFVAAMASHLADHLTFDDRNEHPQQPDLEKQTSVRPPSGEGSTRPYAATDTSNPPGTAQNSVRDRKKPVDQKSKLNPMGPFYVLGEPTTRRLLMFGNFEMILSAGFTIYIWVNIRSFDDNPCAQYIHYVIFFKSVPIVSTVMTKVAISLAVFMTLFLMALPTKLSYYFILPFIALFACRAGSSNTDVPGPPADKYEIRLEKIVTSLQSYVRFIAMSIEFLAFGYTVACTELLLRRNKVDTSNSDLSFGQILALMAIVPSLKSLVEKLWETLGNERRKKLVEELWKKILGK